MKTGNCTNSNSGESNFPCYLLSVTSECSAVTPACCPGGCWRCPAGKNGRLRWFSFPCSATERRGKRQATAPLPTWWPDEGFRVQNPLAALHMQARQDGSEAGPCLDSVLKTDEAMVLGLGPSGSLQGPLYWAGRLGLDHSWRAAAESNGMVERARGFLATPDAADVWPSVGEVLNLSMK